MAKNQPANEVVEGADGKPIAVKRGRAAQKVKFVVNVLDEGIVARGVFVDNTEVEMVLPSSLINQAACAGLLHKLMSARGDDLEAAKTAVNGVIAKLQAGEWEAGKPGRKAGAAKVDDLAKAVAIVKGITEEMAVGWLATKDRTHKMKLRSHGPVAAELAKMKAAAAAAAPVEGQDSLFDGI